MRRKRLEGVENDEIRHSSHKGKNIGLEGAKSLAEILKNDAVPTLTRVDLTSDEHVYSHKGTRWKKKINRKRYWTRIGEYSEWSTYSQHNFDIIGTVQ